MVQECCHMVSLNYVLHIKVKYFSGFIEDCPSGKLHKKKALKMYKMILPEKNAIVFVNHIFRIFDKDNNGYIDFKVRILYKISWYNIKYLYHLLKEFMIATDMTTGGSVEERLRWAFKMYDQDGSGEVNSEPNQYKNQTK